MVMGRRAVIGSVFIVGIAALVLLAMGRPPICTCGTIDLWGQVGPEQSQMLADWYSPSHFIHGLAFYGLAWLFLRQWSIEWRFLLAMVVETAWELAENTPLVIDRYREATMALGYTGDSMLNSLSDIVMTALGFLVARKIPVWASVGLAIAFELLTLAVIRDNLTLNIWMLLFPTDAIRVWQAGA